MKAFAITSLIILFITSLAAGETTTHGVDTDSDNRNYPGFEILIYENPHPANLFIHSMAQTRYMAILSPDLLPLWFINSESLGYDFKPNRNGKLTYFQRDELFWIMMDEKMIEIDTLACVNGYFADSHDIQVLPDGHYFLIAYDEQFIDMSEIVPGGHPNALVEGLIIQEFDGEYNLILEWKSWDHYEITDYVHGNLTSDEIRYVHGNAIDITQDGNILLSSRSLDEVTKIDRTTGDIIWRFGGSQNQFTIINDPLGGFYSQHDSRETDSGTIILFDNGQYHDPHVSRIVEYELNEETMEAELIWSFTHPNEYFSASMGSVQRLENGNTLICWGNITPSPGSGAIITEVDPSGNIQLEIAYNEVYQSYRVRKSDWKFGIDLVRGNINLDGVIDIFDIVETIDYIINGGEQDDVFHLYKCDLNFDHEIDLLDVTLLVNLILDGY